MSFELLLFVAAGAAIACFLKGYPLRGLLAIAVLAGGFAAAVAAGPALTMPAMLVTVGVAVWLAWPPAEPGSYWDRHSAVDVDGVRLLDKESASARLGRTVAGAILGLAPGVLFVVGVAVVDAIVDLTGDQTQIAFLGIPIAFFGMIAGALLGRGWVPRRAWRDRTDRVRV